MNAIVPIPPSQAAQSSSPARARYAAQPSSWLAELELWFALSAGKTRLVRRRHLGPLVVQRPFHPEKDGTCHVYLLHPPGGVAGGDRLDLRFHLDAGARALLTTPGATKFYRSEHGAGAQSAAVAVGAGAVCEYLPQETIVFDGADARIETKVLLASDATYVGWDFLCLGRPAAGERFETGRLSQRIEIVRDGRPVWFERLELQGDSPLMQAAFALAGQPTWGTMIYAGAVADEAAERVRAAIGDAGDGVFSVSQLEEAVVCRYLGPRVGDGKALFARAWNVLRSLGQGKAADRPRIWAT
ncbi:MAG: urease accessory protein UreD [Bosea sp.]|uniref:urease accessory protein UreD n=1 Tax=Bosea sp. (in: a-proteobacteria) TaxID=1871050 RepID=UPI0023938928|nr:urease accessory protein UreD [Bosea sp. (in: a-proteobacteria)]MCP4736809.1 urease accessory protein UreD [Bosea sp. (in: a-proteobacteria)]